MTAKKENPVGWVAPHRMTAISDYPIPSAQWMERFEAQPESLVEAIQKWWNASTGYRNFAVLRDAGSKNQLVGKFRYLTDALAMWMDLHSQFDASPLIEFADLCLAVVHYEDTGNHWRYYGIKFSESELVDRIKILSTECHHLCFRLNRIALFQCEKVKQKRGELVVETDSLGLEYLEGRIATRRFLLIEYLAKLPKRMATFGALSTAITWKNPPPTNKAITRLVDEVNLDLEKFRDHVNFTLIVKGEQVRLVELS